MQRLKLYMAKAIVSAENASMRTMQTDGILDNLEQSSVAHQQERRRVQASRGAVSGSDFSLSVPSFHTTHSQYPLKNKNTDIARINLRGGLFTAAGDLWGAGGL